MLGIIDSKICNIFSVENALNYLNIEYISSSSVSELENCSRFILPGVGTFDQAITNLDKLGLSDFIKNIPSSNKPLLGICLGMQLLFEKSEEGQLPGLGLIPGQVKKLPSKIIKKIPHIGWNSINFDINKTKILNGLANSSDFYFIHSFFTDFSSEIVNASSQHENFSFKCVVEKDHIFGTQFHPEKSQDNGLKVLRNFSNL